ncbi:sensor domain-containing diguanylate cyclase [Sphingomonas sp. PAMC 26617]|uniref:sensor domain-containing diguanylate cyclase n=1 Tax=Sphingomonas sp. PAMC 26617 TaxID=1112216 RepID=UPI00028A3477|nr:sensor domain-containing diguanylate cyclase [Sphingomonas sp. PAMC 26617]
MKHWAPDDAKASAVLQLIAEHSSDVIALVGPDMTFSYISGASERLFLRSPPEVIGHPVFEFVFHEDLPVLVEANRVVMGGGSNDATVTVRVIRGDGSLLWVEIASRVVENLKSGTPGDRAVIMRDVSQRKALEDELRAMAMKDGLTGLANRRAFDEALSGEWKRTLVAKSQLSLLLADIDHFKKFNDAHGHQVGDDCLRSVATAFLSATSDDKNVVARYGGEELAVVLPEANRDHAMDVAEHIRAAVEALQIPHGVEVGGVITVSIGVATALARDGATAVMPQTLLTSADRALYLAKEAGKNCCKSALLLAS